MVEEWKIVFVLALSLAIFSTFIDIWGFFRIAKIKVKRNFYFYLFILLGLV